MSVTQDQLNRITAQAEKRERQGYFEVVRGGDQKAASLWARLLAYDLNPKGITSDVGWLSKGGGANVDGWAEDAICANANPADLSNVVDLVGGAGAPGARPIADEKPRRESDKWAKPQPLSPDELDYLLAGGVPEPPQPPQQPGFPYPDEGTAVKAYEQRVEKSYKSVGRKFPDEADSSAFRHFSRFGYSCHEMESSAAADKHIKELRSELGAPPE